MNCTKWTVQNGNKLLKNTFQIEIQKFPKNLGTFVLF